MLPLKDDNPTSTFPYVTIGIIALNFLVYFYMLAIGPFGEENMVARYAAVPARLFGLAPDGGAPAYPTLITSMFMHGGILHIGGNMLFLWIFGDNIEDYLGHLPYLLFYLACGVAAAVAHGITDTASTLPMLGASGAISGVLAAYMVLYPRARVWTFFFFLFFWQVVRVPAVLIIGLWILLQFINGIASTGRQAMGGVAWFAHVGGFIAGLGMILVIRLVKRPKYIQ